MLDKQYEVKVVARASTWTTIVGQASIKISKTISIQTFAFTTQLRIVW